MRNRWFPRVAAAVRSATSADNKFSTSGSYTRETPKATDLTCGLKTDLTAALRAHLNANKGRPQSEAHQKSGTITSAFSECASAIEIDEGSTTHVHNGPLFRILFRLPQHFMSHGRGISFAEGNVLHQIGKRIPLTPSKVNVWQLPSFIS